MLDLSVVVSALAASLRDLDSSFTQQLDVKYSCEMTRKLCEMSLHKTAGTQREHEAASAIVGEMGNIGLDEVRRQPFPIYTNDLL